MLKFLLRPYSVGTTVTVFIKLLLNLVMKLRKLQYLDIGGVFYKCIGFSNRGWTSLSSMLTQKGLSDQLSKCLTAAG